MDGHFAVKQHSIYEPKIWLRDIFQPNAVEKQGTLNKTHCKGSDTPRVNVCLCTHLCPLTCRPQLQKSGIPVVGLAVDPQWASACSPWRPSLMSLPHQVQCF